MRNVAYDVMKAMGTAHGRANVTRTPDGPRAAEVVPLPFYDPGNDSGGD